MPREKFSFQFSHSNLFITIQAKILELIQLEPTSILVLVQTYYYTHNIAVIIAGRYYDFKFL